MHLLEKLGYAIKERNGIVYLWPEKAQKKKLPPLVLRRVVVVDGRNRRMCLLTNVLESDELSETEAVALYTRRWGVELLFRGMKQTPARRRCSAIPRPTCRWNWIGAWWGNGS